MTPTVLIPAFVHPLMHEISSVLEQSIHRKSSSSHLNTSLDRFRNLPTN
jgi:hypothetical protein